MFSRAPTVANILIADDTVENLRLLATMLGGEGYEVRPVTSGRQALIAAGREPPDLILLDINMPDMNGYEVCAALKKSPSLADIPVIFLTALNDVADKVRAFQVGGIDYITKPFQLEEVHVRVRTHLALRKTRLELERNIEKLRALETLRDDLVCMIVHDMRSPLLALSVHLELVRMEAGSTLGEVAQGDLQAATQMSNRIAQMANDLLDVSRLEANKMPIERQVRDLGALVRGVVGALGVLGAQHVLHLECASEVLISCDDGLVRRVMENLLSNAFKHAPSGSRVSLNVQKSAAGARVEVSDEGAGVPEAAVDRIFQKFGVANKGRDAYSHSVGLGLAFCKLAVQAHGGSIGVTGREPRGSTFWFELPS